MKRKILKFIMIALLIIVAFIIQSCMSLVLGQAVVTPNLILIITCIFGFVRGTNAGIMVGLFCGLLVDIMYGELIGLYALLYIYMGFFSGLFADLLQSSRFFMPALLVFGNDLVYNVLVYIFRFLLRNKLAFSFYFEKIILPEMIFTAVIMLVVYKPLYRLNEQFFTNGQESELNFGK